MTGREPPKHELELIHSPMYGSKGKHSVFCTCGWASEEHATPGLATIAGWKHIHSQPVNPEATEAKK